MQAPPASRPLTGRMVLVCFVGFFGIVFAVNAVMIRQAVSTFGGVETGNAYKAGLAFGQEIAAASNQERRHWRVLANVTRNAAGDAVIELTAFDERGTALAALDAEAKLVHPADARRDRIVDLAPLGGGRYRGAADVDPGLWTVQIDLSRNGERLFRSRSKLVLK